MSARQSGRIKVDRVFCGDMGCESRGSYRMVERTLERRSVTLRIGDFLLWTESTARWACK